MRSRKTHRKQRRKPTVDLYPLMRGVEEALVHDLSDSNLDRMGKCCERGQDYPTEMGWPPYVFKKWRQIRHFGKRVIWPNDKSFKVLSDEAFTAFADSQKGFVLPEPMSRRASLVIHRAAELCQLVLGEFDYDEWFDSCSYGKRAAYKLPRKRAYLDERIYNSSGTAIQQAAFGQALARDVHLLRAVRSRRRKRKTYAWIKATAVPKSFKSARIIAPDTVLGGFLSRGLGDLIRDKLEKGTQIDLALQQERHRRWAQDASVHGRQATIDMSKASDSFTWRHIECLVPRSWHDAMLCVRTSHCEVSGVPIPLNSFMLMGSGHTFPLQTLLFWSLAEATRTLLQSRGRVSVYGDDIMIPTRMSTHFIAIMSELGFVVNSEKSFYDAPDPLTPSHTFFRESCGGDYKGGIDVRPYMPECDLQSDRYVSSNEYLAWCHKLINGLLDRWDTCELPVTLTFLLHAISNRKRRICFVPTWEVDHAGIKHYIPPHLTFGLTVSYITYKSSVPSYWRLTLRRKKRPRRERERPYVWYAYYLKRDNVEPRFKLPLLYELLYEERRAEMVQSYETAVSLNGEPNRSLKGDYRWTLQGPKELPAGFGRPRGLHKDGTKRNLK